MQLQKYIEEIGQSKFCDLIGISQSQASRYQTLQEIPRPETARKIKQVSHGLVDYEDIYEPFFKAQEVDPRQLKLNLK